MMGVLTLAGWSMGTMCPAPSTARNVNPPPLLTCPATAPPTVQSTAPALRNASWIVREKLIKKIYCIAYRS